MLYDKYVEKIKKVAKTKGVIMFFKFVFLAIFLLALLFSITFIANKGKLKKGIEMPSEINYGEDYDFSAQTQFGGSVRYFEYRAENSTEWSKEKPILAGNYYVRAITNKFIGKRTSAEFGFTINKTNLDINLTSDTITYGDYPSYSSTGLKNKDSISEIVFNFDSFNLTKTNIGVGLVKVSDVNGADVTNCYNITSNGKEVGFNKKKITITPTMDNSNFVYSGEEIKYQNTYTINTNLGYSDKSVAEGKIYDLEGNETKAILPGNYKVKVTSYKLSNTTDDVSINYDVATDEFNFSIVKRDITIETGSNSKVYDNTPLIDTTFNVSSSSAYGLIAGDKLVDLTTENQSITYYAESGIKNVRDIRIYDSENNDITNTLYNVTYNYGTLFINKKDVTIETTSDDTFVFDGNIHSHATLSDLNITSGSLVSSDELYLISGSQPQISAPGKVTNAINYSIRNIDTQADVKNSYNINRIDGELIMYSKGITIKSKDVSSVYGNDYSLDENEYFELTETYTGFDEDIINNTRVEVEYYKNNEKVVPKDVGEYQIRIKSVETIEKYSINISTASYGILTITPKPISIALKSLDKTEYKYSGDVVSYYDEFNNFNITSGSLVYNDSLKISVNYYENSTLLPSAPKNVGSYSVYYDSYVDANGNNSNYIITSINNLAFTITKRNVTFTLNNLTVKEYDGMPYDYSNAAYKITGDGFAANESITPILSAYLGSSITTPIDRGNYELGISGLTYNNALESNYNVYYSSRVALVINARTLGIAFNNINGDNKEYDGLPLTYSNDYNNFTIINGSIISGHSIKISYNFYIKNGYSTITPINANDYVIRYSDYIVSGTNKNNYYITCSDKACKINKRTIEIAPNDLTVTYGSSISYNEGFKYISTNRIVESGTFNITVRYYNDNYSVITPKDADTYYIGIYNYSTNISNFNNNYNVVYNNNYATLTINKFNVNISLLSMSDVEYSGENVIYPSGNNNYHTSVTMPYSSERISISVSYQKKVNGTYIDIDSVKDCGEYKVIYSDFNTNPYYVKSNYNVIWDEEVVTFKVTKHALTITLYDDTSTYGNTYVYPNTAFIASGLASSESIIVNAKIYNGSELVSTNDTKLLNVGIYDIIATIDDIILTGSSLDNYDVTIYNSNLEIVRRDLYISLINLQELVYDGMAHYYDNNSFNQNGLVNGDNLEISVIYDNDSTVIPIDAKTYVVSISNHIITRNSTNLNGNYITHYVNDVDLTINRKDITISLLNQEITYGDEFSYPTYPNKQFDIVDGSLVNGERISVTVSVYNGNTPISDSDVSRLNVNDYSIKYTSIELLIGRSINNYNFVKINPSTLTINKKNVELTLKEFAQAQYKYNGENVYYYSGYNNYSLALGLVNDDYLEVFVDYYSGETKLNNAPKNVGTYSVKFKSYVDNHGFSNNYNITSTYMPEFEIIKRSIIVTPSSIGPFVYDGSIINVSISGLSIAGDGFAIGEGIDPTYGVYVNNELVVPKDAGTYEQRIISYKGIGYYNDSNYDLTLVSSYFTISKKELTILPSDITNIIYNDTEYDRVSYYFNTNVNDERFLITVSYYDLLNNPVNPKNAGTYIIRVKDSDVVNDTANKKNYVLSYSDATLIINPLEITIMPKHYSNMDNLVYSGLAYQYSNTGYNYTVIGTNNFYNDDAYDFMITPLYKKYNGATFVNVENAKDAGDYRVYVDEIIGTNTNYTISIIDDYIEFSIAKYVINAEFAHLPSATKLYDGIAYKINDYYSYDNCTFIVPEEIQLMIKPIIIKDNQEVDEAKNVGEYTIILNDDAFEIINGIKSNYIVIMDQFDFSINQINLNVTINDYSHAYTGSAILDENYDGYVINNEDDIVDGEDIRLHFIYKKDNIIIVSPVEVGTYEIIYGYYDINDAFPEVYNYKIIAENATLSINRIALSVYASSRDDELVDIDYLYTGNVIDESLIKAYPEGLQTGDSITNYTLEYFDSFRNALAEKPKEIGYYYVRIKSVEINNGSSTSNYDISYDLYYSPLTIKGGNISITLTSNSNITKKIYGEVINPSDYIILDGSNSTITSSTYNKYHSNSNYMFSVKLSYDSGITPKNAGTYDISLDNVLINGKIVDSNLFTSISLSSSSNDLIIEKKDITILAITLDGIYEYTYDGHYLDNNNVGYDLYDENGIKITDLPYDDELNDVDIIYTDLNHIECSPINAGAYYVDVDPNFTRSSNYNYELLYTTLVIDKAVISANMIKTQIENRVYDGTATNKNKVINNYNILINGEVNFICNDVSGLNEVVSLVFSATFNSITTLLEDCTIKDAYTYTFICTDFNITNGNKNNYQLDNISSSYLIINKRLVTLKTGDYSGVYDGNEHTNLSVIDVTNTSLENAGLATNDLAYNISTDPKSITDYGMISNDIVEVKILDDLDNDRTQNYIITLEYGTLSVLKKDIHIKTLGNDSLVYTGSMQHFNEYKVVVDEIEYDSFDDVPENLALISGEEAICSSEVILLDAKTYLNELSFEIIKPGFISSTDNYNFIFDEIGEIVINKLDVEFELVSSGFLKVYDNKPYEFTNSDCENVFVEEGEYSIFIEFIDAFGNHLTEFVDAKEYLNLRVFRFDILDSNNDSRISNYNITILNKDNCNFEITKKEIEINTDSKIKDCDGLPLTYYYFTYVNAIDQEFLTTNNHTVYPIDELLPRITNVGEIDNDLTNAIRVKDKFNNDVTNNYKFIVNTMGKLTINKLSIKTKSNNTIQYSGIDLDINRAVNNGLTPVGKDLKINLYNNGYTLLKYDDSIEEYVIVSEAIELGKYRVLFNDFSITKGTVNITGTIGVVGGNTLNDGEKYIFDGLSYYYADFEIIQRSLSVKPSENVVEKTYDGISLELKEDFYDLVGSIFKEHTLKVYWSNSISEYETGNKKVSIIDAKVFDINGNDVTYNYNITIDTASVKLIVYKRYFEIETESIERLFEPGMEIYSEYNGPSMELNYDNNYNAFLVDSSDVEMGLISGHRLVLTDRIISRLNYCGTIENKIKNYVIYDEDGNDVTDCYYKPICSGELTLDSIVSFDFDIQDLVVENITVYDRRTNTTTVYSRSNGTLGYFDAYISNDFSLHYLPEVKNEVVKIKFYDSFDNVISSTKLLKNYGIELYY